MFSSSYIRVISSWANTQWLDVHLWLPRFDNPRFDNQNPVSSPGSTYSPVDTTHAISFLQGGKMSNPPSSPRTLQPTSPLRQIEGANAVQRFWWRSRLAIRFSLWEEGRPRNLTAPWYKPSKARRHGGCDVRATREVLLAAPGEKKIWRNLSLL